MTYIEEKALKRIKGELAYASRKLLESPDRTDLNYFSAVFKDWAVYIGKLIDQGRTK